MINDDDTNLVLDILYCPTEHKLIREPEKSNIEYKYILDKKDTERKDNMVSQMLWRMNEGRNQYGRYEAHYILGIKDDGHFSDITEKQLNKTTNIFKSICKKANAKIFSEKTYVFPGNKLITHLVIRKQQSDRRIPESNILIMGPHDSGKTSLMGRLTYGQNDDGNGFSRKLVLRHAHEKISGITSSPKYDIIGFAGSDIMNYAIGIDFNMENIYNSSDRLINLIDAPGDMRYIKTIMYSVSSINPHHIIVCVPLDSDDDKKDPIYMYKDYYVFIVSWCIVYNILPIIVMTKCDLIINVDLNMLSQKIMTDFNRLRDDLIGTKIDTIIDTIIDFTKSSCVQVSNITDVGYDNLISILNRLPTDTSSLIQKDILFTIIDSFMIPDTGHIVHGILKHGMISVDDEVVVLCHGLKLKKKIKTIRRKSLDVERLIAGESGSITFHGKIDKLIDKTAVILGPSWDDNIISKARIRSAFNTIKIKPHQYMLFVDNSIVTVILSQSDDPDVFDLTCTNGSTFLLNTNIGILKDEQQIYYFINFV